jgi:hypothetical protein
VVPVPTGPNPVGLKLPASVLIFGIVTNAKSNGDILPVCFAVPAK